MDKTQFKNYMDLLVNAFADTTSSMLDITFEQDDETGLEDKNKAKVIVSMVGKFKGRIIFTVGWATSKILADRFMGEEVTEDMEVLACVAEILNIFSGKFVTDVNNQLKKQELWLTPPAVIEGEDIDIISPHSDVHTEILYFKSEYGKVQLDIGFEG